MSKLTNDALYRYAQVKYDKYNTPHFTRRAFQWIYSEARREWLRLKYKDYETVEAIRSDLRPFNRSFDFSNTRRLDLSTIQPPLEYITAVYADFNFECNGKTTPYTFAVRPFTKDNAAVSMTDPFNQPDDEFPVYLDRNENGISFLEVLSLTVPITATVEYLKSPDDFNLVLNPSGFTEEGETQQYEILDIAVKKVELSIENFAKFQAMREEIQTNGG